MNSENIHLLVKFISCFVNYLELNCIFPPHNKFMFHSENYHHEVSLKEVFKINDQIKFLFLNVFSEMDEISQLEIYIEGSGKKVSRKTKPPR